MITVLHHADADGFGAAYALWTRLDDDTTFIPVQYGQPVPDLPEETDCLYIVDFSYARETIKSLADRFGWDSIVVLDHHKTAEKELADFPFATFDANKSGAVLAWEHANPFQSIPLILQYVQDRDLWHFELPHSEEVNLYIASLPLEFEAWERFDLDVAIATGAAIKAFRDNQIKNTLRDVRVTDFFGHLTPVVNCSANISEVGYELLKLYPDSRFAVMYTDRADGQRSYSLRSRGDFDVADLCRMLGGGGHKAAAGFVKPAPQAW
jgi:oligoribonuclease NrnB/cAMP/cGMP phosphodiesterase (DHH superfamily)